LKVLSLTIRAYIQSRQRVKDCYRDGLFFYQLILNKLNEADILARRAKSVSARKYALYLLDWLTGTYIQGWERLGVTL
jgi:hypothetical protein